MPWRLSRMWGRCGYAVLIHGRCSALARSRIKSTLKTLRWFAPEENGIESYRSGARRESASYRGSPGERTRRIIPGIRDRGTCDLELKRRRTQRSAGS